MKRALRKKIYLEVHALQTVPPSCVNRDDLGDPKTAIYGGVVRSRVSSQCWKRAMRDMFQEHLEKSEKSYRTRMIPEMLYSKMAQNSLHLTEQQMEEEDYDKEAFEDAREEAKEMSNKFLQVLGLVQKEKGTEEDGKKVASKKESEEVEEDEESKKEEQNMLFYISMKQLEALSEAIPELVVKYANKTAQDIQKSNNLKKQIRKDLEKPLQEREGLDGIEIKLFGRMIAALPDMEPEVGTSIVAHALSTHAIENEYDYTTAIDDVTGKCGYIGGSYFNSANLYRYTCIDVEDFGRRLGDMEHTALALRNFVEAFIKSMPTGKIHSYANTTPVNNVYVSITVDGSPCNLVCAFEKAIQASSEGYIKPSAKALDDYVIELYSDENRIVEKPVKNFVVGSGLPKIAAIGQRVSLPVLLDEIENYIKQVTL